MKAIIVQFVDPDTEVIHEYPISLPEECAAVLLDPSNCLSHEYDIAFDKMCEALSTTYGTINLNYIYVDIIEHY